MVYRLHSTRMRARGKLRMIRYWSPAYWSTYRALGEFYNVRQLYGIAPSALMCCLKTGRNLCQLQYKPSDNIQKTSSDRLTKDVFDRWISESNFWPRPLRIRACVISTSVYKMADEIQNRRGVKSKLSVVGLLIELMSASYDGSGEYKDDNVLMEIAVSR